MNTDELVKSVIEKYTTFDVNPSPFTGGKPFFRKGPDTYLLRESYQGGSGYGSPSHSGPSQTSNDPDLNKMASEIQSAMRQAGFDVTIISKVMKVGKTGNGKREVVFKVKGKGTKMYNRSTIKKAVVIRAKASSRYSALANKSTATANNAQVLRREIAGLIKACQKNNPGGTNENINAVVANLNNAMHAIAQVVDYLGQGESKLIHLAKQLPFATTNASPNPRI